MGAGAERVVVVDRDNQVIGSATRAEMRAQGLTHRASYILVFDATGQLLIHRRTAAKDIYPGHLDVAVGGVILAGEDYRGGALRELEEELGVAGVPLEPLFTFHHEDPTVGNRVWGQAFRCVWDGPLRLQEAEIESARFMPPGEALDLTRREAFTPDGVWLLRRFLGAQGSAA